MLNALGVQVYLSWEKWFGKNAYYVVKKMLHGWWWNIYGIGWYILSRCQSWSCWCLPLQGSLHVTMYWWEWNECIHVIFQKPSIVVTWQFWDPRSGWRGELLHQYSSCVLSMSWNEHSGCSRLLCRRCSTVYWQISGNETWLFADPVSLIDYQWYIIMIIEALKPRHYFKFYSHRALIRMILQGFIRNNLVVSFCILLEAETVAVGRDYLHINLKRFEDDFSFGIINNTNPIFTLYRWYFYVNSTGCL